MKYPPQAHSQSTNSGSRQTNSSSSNNEEISPIKVDLTKESSENSDIQDNDDCIEISSSIPVTFSFAYFYLYWR